MCAEVGDPEQKFLDPPSLSMKGYKRIVIQVFVTGRSENAENFSVCMPVMQFAFVRQGKELCHVI